MDPVTLSALIVYGSLAAVPLGGSGLALLLATHERRGTLGPLAEQWRAAAANLDLLPTTDRATPVRWALDFAGNRDDRRVEATVSLKLGQPPETRVEVRVRLRAPLLAGVALTRESAGTEALRYAGVEDVTLGDAAIDGMLHAATDAGMRPALVSFAGTEAGRAALTALARDPEVELRRGWLVHARAGGDPGGLSGRVEEVTALADRLDEAVLGGVHAVAAARRLGITATDAGWCARGDVDGRPVELTLARTGPRLLVSLGDHAPDGLVLDRRDRGGDGTLVPLVNPVLGRLVTARATAPDRAARALAPEAATEAVLAVVEGRPGSVVRDGRIMVALGAAPSATEIEAALAEALALAGVLEAG